MKTFSNCYELLGINHNATNEDIKKGYRKKAMEYHSDKDGESKAANTMFLLITEAKDVLLDSESRLEHDFQFGIKTRPQNPPKEKVVYKEKPVYLKQEPETDWGSAIALGLVGLLLGAALVGSSGGK